MENEVLPDFSLDVFELCCPLPLLKVKSLVYRLSSGKTLAVRRVHFLQIADFEDWCQRTGQSLQLKHQVSTENFDIIIKIK